MGDGTFVRSRRQGAKKKARRLVRLGFDVPLFLVVFTLVVFGLLMVYSASWDFSLLINDSPTAIFMRQLQWLALAAAGAMALAFIDYHIWQRMAVPALVVTILLLIIVLAIGDERLGAVRGLLGGSIQPSELAKLVTVIYLGVWLYSKGEILSNVNFGLLPLAGILGVVGGLIFLQPDLSAVITVVFLGILLFFLAGGELKQLALLFVITVTVGGAVVWISPTGRDRVLSFIQALGDPMQADYHLLRAYEAFAKGGWFGVGIGKANTKLTGLPVPPTDSIFAVVGEETGVLGASVLVVLFGLIIWRGLVISRQAPDQLGALLAAGLSLWIVMEGFVNMAVMVGLLPFAGNALPFISAGGSNLMVSMAAIGILMNISRLSKLKQEEIGRSLSAVVDLRGRKRGGRIPRAGGPASAGE